MWQQRNSFWFSVLHTFYWAYLLKDDTKFVVFLLFKNFHWSLQGNVTDPALHEQIKLMTRESPDVCLYFLCITGREFVLTINEVEKPSWQQVEWVNWGNREIRIFSWEKNKKKHSYNPFKHEKAVLSSIPVMLLRPSSLKDRTMEVGLASPGATHFFLVRWCFPGCPTNFMPFGTEIFTWTCESFGNVIYWKYQLRSQTDLCEWCETHGILHKNHRMQVIHSSQFLVMDLTDRSAFRSAIPQVFLGDATRAGQMRNVRIKHVRKMGFLGKKNSFKIN